jgi:predicted  nucleic acid-binding Zn-ribbon protein
VSIFCNECNKTFDQTPNNHLAGNGCPDCAIIRNGKKKRITFENFKTRANEIHLNLYGYEISEWVDRNTEIDILCKECNKIFNQLPSSHLNGRGCPDCANKSRSTSQRKSDDIFLAELVNRRGDRYLYLKTKYNGATELITVTCRTHGDFDQRADIHLAGANCPLCVIRVSAPEFDFLNYLNIPNTKEARQYKIKRYKIDGYDANTNTIYEFLGDYYHGNPMRFKPTDYNQKCHKTFKELYDGTFKKLHKLKELGYIVKYIWEYDWERFNNGIDKEPKIITYNC